MKFSRQFSVLLIFLFCVFLGAAVAAGSPVPVPVSSTSVLPSEFAGWQIKGAVAKSDDPAAADAVNAPVLKEYGFQRLEKAAYTRDDGRNLVVKAAVFGDAIVAYGAFTYYNSAEMGDEIIGRQAAFLDNRVLFYPWNVPV